MRMNMGFSGLSQAHNIQHTSYSNTTLVVEKIKEWDWFQRFLDQNPDVAERYEVHKTYEILDDTRN